MSGSDISRGRACLALAALFALNLLLRVFYIRYDFVNGDEAVRALTALGLLDGQRLYVDVITDKPPGATFFYAAVFAVFGPSMAAVHLAAIAWNFCTALAVFLAAAHLYDRRAGLWAALFFVYFSTNYLTQDMMAANTELLMILPATVSFHFFMRSCGPGPAPKRYAMLFFAGLGTGLAALFKQVGGSNLIFFALYELIQARRWTNVRLALLRLAPAALGFLLVAALLLLWLAHAGAATGFWRNAVLLGFRYVGSLPVETWLRFMIGRTLGYVLFNAALWALAGLAAARAISNMRALDEPSRRDLAVAAWAACSLIGPLVGGRFFGHYFIQVLPPLSILASRGAKMLADRIDESRAAKAVACALALATCVSFFRFHHRTAILAYEAAIGARTRWSENWGMTKREREVQEVARFVRDRIGSGQPLYIWGYALDVYWRSGCRPASRYLTPYYVTGRFYPEVTEAEQGDEFWRQARREFIEDLKRNRPRLVLNTDEAIWSLPYPEIVEFFIENYYYEGQIGSRPFLVFALKEE